MALRHLLICCRQGAMALVVLLGISSLRAQPGRGTENIPNLNASQLDPSTPDYQNAKREGRLPSPQQAAPHPELLSSATGILEHATAGLLIPLDGSFTTAMNRNDDSYTAAIPLQFAFQLYDSAFRSLYVNNNGNVSFGSPYSHYTSTGFPVSGFPMVAPFWADVDTRGSASGLVYYRSEPHRFVVIWDHVGYYPSATDKLNTFELIITDGSDPLIGVGNNAAYSYTDMQWTTGSASGGSGGFGGTPATVGINRGNGTNFAQIGRFNHAGADYDGPYNNADGVDYLDNKLLTFSTSIGRQTVFLSGKVVDETTLLPIQGAAIQVLELGLIANSDLNGSFQFQVQRDATYSLMFSAAAYYPKQLQKSVSFSDLNIGNVGLKKQPADSYDLIELQPTPNASVSEVEDGGTLYRYYQVVTRSSRIGTPNIDVEFQRSDGAIRRSFTSKNDDDMVGLLVVAIPSSDLLSSRTTFLLRRVGSESVAQPYIQFGCERKPREHEKSFEINREVTLGVGLQEIASGATVSLKGNASATPKLRMISDGTGSGEVDKVAIEMAFQSDVGLELAVEHGASMKVGSIRGGAFVGASVGGYVVGTADASYKYAYESDNNSAEKLAKFSNVILASLSLFPSPALNSIVLQLADMAFYDYLESASGGIGVKGTGDFQASIGITTQRDIGLGIGAGISGGVDFSAILSHRHTKALDNEGRFTLSGSVEGGAQAGVFSWGYKNPGNPNYKLFSQISKKSGFGLSYSLGSYEGEATFSILKDQSGNVKQFGADFGETTPNMARSYSFLYSGPLGNAVSSGILSGLSAIANPRLMVSPLSVGNDFLTAACSGAIEEISAGQRNGLYPAIDYTIDSSSISSSGPYSFALDLAFGIGVNFGGEVSWKTSQSAQMESGVILAGRQYSGRHFPLAKYSSIPTISLTTDQALKKILQDGAAALSAELVDRFWTKINIFGFQRAVNQIAAADTQTYGIAPNGSTLRMTPTAVPIQLQPALACYSWSWYGGSPTAQPGQLAPKVRALAENIRHQQQTLARMDYGIGGFYQFSPKAVPLNGRAVLTLAYADSDVFEISEQALAVFYRDSVSPKWKFLGGVVDPTANRISVSVDTLGLFTIAPILPEGDIDLGANTDTLRMGFSAEPVWIQNLKLNNGQPVPNGTLFTVTGENAVITNSDADPLTPGIQVASSQSRLDLNVISGMQVGKASIAVRSVRGHSAGVREFYVVDRRVPATPTITKIIADDSQLRIVVSDPDTTIRRYEVYYDVDSGVPYNGTALVGGIDSPFLTERVDTVAIPRLSNSMMYYVSVRAVNAGDVRSAYSNEVSGQPHDITPPGRILQIDFSVLADSTYLVRWLAPGDNDYEGQATRYYAKFSAAQPVDTMAWWAAARSMTDVGTPSPAGSFDYVPMPPLSADSTYYLGLATEDEVGNRSPISVFRVARTRMTIPLSLVQGWNLVSYPLKERTVARNAFSLMEGRPFVFASLTGYVQCDTLQPNVGSWVKSSAGYQWSVNGTVLAESLVAVQRDWNLIGANSYPVAVSGITTNPPGLLTSPFYGYEITGYTNALQLQPGNGYWVKVTSNGWLRLPRQQNLQRRETRTVWDDRKIRIASRTQIQKDLWIVDDAQYPLMDAPPLPPQGPDARFTTEKFGERASASSLEIAVSGMEFPLTLSQVNLRSQYEVSGNVTGKQYGVLSGINRVSVTDPRDVRIFLKVLNVPEDYVLEQNYPNPFNPVTTIVFGLPTTQKVSLLIYDILGRQVNTLIDSKEFDAGYHQLRWNGAQLASGVYFIRLKVGPIERHVKAVIIR